MQTRRRSERIATQKDVFYGGLTGVTVFKKQQVRSRSRSKSRKKEESSSQSRGRGKIEAASHFERYASPDLLNVKKSVSFSPNTSIFDDEGVCIETPISPAASIQPRRRTAQANNYTATVRTRNATNRARDSQTQLCDDQITAGASALIDVALGNGATSNHHAANHVDKNYVQKDVVCGNEHGATETMTAADIATITGTDICTMDDDVFECEGSETAWRTGHYKDSFYEADYTIYDDQIMSTQSWVALIFILVLLSFIFLASIFPYLFTVRLDEQKDDYAVHWKNSKGIFIISFLGCLFSALIIGCGCGCFSWMVTFFDSLEPGVYPPTPLSPKHIKAVSPHSYHFGYVMSVLNGFAMFVVAIWWMSDAYLITRT